MLKLNEYIEKQRIYNDISTGVDSLDKLLRQSLPFKNTIYDFQSSPNCDGMFIVTASIIISHLKRGRKVIIIDTGWNKFSSFHYLKYHSKYEDTFKSQITYYRIDTFAKLYYKISQIKDPDVLIILNGFQQSIEFYKLELSLTYEEYRNKHRLEQYLTLRNNKLNNLNEAIPQISSSSQLFNVSPTTKFESHLNSFIAKLTQLCINLNGMVIMCGFLDTKFRQFKTISSQENIPSSQLSAQGKNRVVLSPRIFHKSIDSRLIFFKDWYHKTPHFLNNQPIDDKRSITINQSILRFVNAVKVEVRDKLFAPVYFDVDEEFYHEDEEDKEELVFDDIIDLSDLKIAQNVPPTSSPPIDSTVINITATDVVQDEIQEVEEVIDESEEEQVQEIRSATN
ncbi:uncharacterized protein KGF55_005385 [Candida pseudojiufengensis]|uniref:uncharacterized protein n=1 Tax=Candida pseudojiufengensis TaxID=497109 RepID=UPI00222587F3|nr:uncharacterized protein KGF55_005385 [Candida pseudojiufengensis]KAI5959408.1 hypothetical protein KGF55_005385 [Candida pseudojiufengensis]